MLRNSLALWVLLIVTTLNVFSQMNPELSYKVSMEAPHTHYFNVEMTLENVEQDELDFKMAVWTPGSYLVREFAKSVEGFVAKNSSGEVLASEKTNKNTWRVVANGATSVTVSYQVYAFELTVRTSFLDASMGYINGTSIFMFVDGYQQLASQIQIDPYDGWEKISTNLKTVKGNPWLRTSENYDLLADSPILIGNHEIYTFEAVGIPHHLAIYGEGNFDVNQLLRDIPKVCEITAEVIGGQHPCEDYTFIVLNTENSYGGLEHLHSTSLIYPRWSYKPKSKYMNFVSLVAHEYFHLWNVKRIRPGALGPFDYETENYTRQLWIAEGFTSYYDELLLRRADFYTPLQYFDKLEGQINRVENTPGKQVQTVAEASFDAWIKFYRKNENSGNCCVSYYGQGGTLALAMDLGIRHHTKNKKNLDDILKYLWQEYYIKQERGFTEEEMKLAIKEIVGQGLDQFLVKYVYDTQTLDYNKYFGYAGLELVDRNSNNRSTYLGTSTKTENGKLIITSVRRDGPAYNDGLNANDEIIAIDGYRINEKLGDFLTKNYSAGDELTFTVSRDGILQEIKVTLSNSPLYNYKIQKLDNINKLQRKIYEDWIGEDF